MTEAQINEKNKIQTNKRQIKKQTKETREKKEEKQEIKINE